MVMSSALTDQLDPSGQQQQSQQASGRSLFWGLAAIALNAMLQPSFTGSTLSRDVFEGSLAPHRSSPFVCLTDAAADVWLIARHSHRSSTNGTTQNHRPRASPIAVSMRLATFLFGVLPQVIKIFSARGIPVTQAVAAGLLLSTIISLARTLHLVDGQHDLVEAQKHFTDWLQMKPGPPGYDVAEYARISGGRVKGALSLVTLLPHAIALSYIWTAIACRTSIEVTSRDVVNGADWIAEIFLLLTPLYLLLQVVCVTSWRKLWLPRLPVPTIAWITRTYDLVHLFSHEKKCSAARQRVWLPLCFYSALGCYFMAWALKRAASRVLGELGQQHESSSDIQQTDTELASMDQTGTEMLPIPSPNVALVVVSDIDRVSTDIATEAGRHEDSVHDSALLDSSQSGENTQSVNSPPTPDPMDSTTSPEDVTLNEDLSERNDDPPLWIKMTIIPLGIVCLLILHLAGLFPAESSDELAAAEEGNASQHLVQPTNDEPLGSRLWRLPLQPVILLIHLSRSYDGLRFVVRYFFLTVYYLIRGTFVSGAVMWTHPISWAKAKLSNDCEDIAWIAFGMLNIATTAVYYLLIFDGEGTYMPQWTSILG